MLEELFTPRSTATSSSYASTLTAP
jgi:hypothetical protein